MGKCGFAQTRKTYTRWKHFHDRLTKGILVDYKGEHIYWMLMSNGQIIWYSNVNWIENLSTQDTFVV